MKTVIKVIFLWPMYFLVGLLPRNKDVWCFGSYRNKFNDNSKYAFIKCSYNYPDVKCYWITDDLSLIAELQDKGLNAVKRRSLKGLYVMSRAYVYFVSSYTTDIFFWTSRGCYYVNLWHGLPLKKIEYDIENGPLYQKYNGKNILKKALYKIKEPECFKKPDLMFAPSEFWVMLLSKAFSISSDKFIKCGFPRTDVFFDKKLNEKVVLKYGSDFSSQITGRDSKNILLMPTFRDNGANYFEVAGLDFSVLNDFLKKNNCQLYIKLHPSDYSSFPINTTPYEHIQIINDRVDDIYPHLNLFDLLITDYSSVYLDYILLNKEVLFYCFDLNEYIKNSRSLYFNYDEFTPGFKASNFYELIDRLEGFITKETRYDKTEFLKTYFSASDTYINSDAIYEHVRKLRE